MADRGSEFTPSARQMLIVGKLFTTQKEFLTTQELRESIAAYHPRNGEEYSAREINAAKDRLSRDLKDLEKRGIIEIIKPAEESDKKSDKKSKNPDNTGVATKVRYALPRKSRELYLSADEHAAIARARQRLDRRIAPISPYRAEESDQWDPIDKYGIVVRYLEESGADLTVQDLQELFGVSRKKARQVIDEVLGVDDHFGSQVGVVVMTADESDKPEILGIRLAFNRQITPEMRQGSGGGLNPQGRFEYTLPETEERLNLIDAALDTADDGDYGLLIDASHKLSAWRYLLQQVHERGRE